jgi:hypothetical protein
MWIYSPFMALLHTLVNNSHPKLAPTVREQFVAHPTTITVRGPFSFGRAMRMGMAVDETGIVTPERQRFAAVGIETRSSAGFVAIELSPKWIAQGWRRGRVSRARPVAASSFFNSLLTGLLKRLRESVGRYIAS